jgi:ATP-binding cassette, subfamily F, member 3
VIAGKNLTKSFTGDPILENIDFKIGGNIKIGLVGKNGCGKSTLFRLIIEELVPDSGNIQNLGEKIGYIPQEFTFPDELVGEYLEKKLDDPYESYKIDILVSKMEFAGFDPYQEINTLSEGQKMKIKIIELMLQDPTVVLIDEPTNHLDIEGILWFERYIKHLDVATIMISHDREFLNKTVDEIWEIENRKILRFVGNYDTYKEEKLRLIEKWDDEYIKFLKQKQKLETLLTNVRKIKGGKQRGRAVKAAKKRIDREVEQNKKTEYVEKKMKNVTFNTDVTSDKRMIRFGDASKSYGKKLVFEDLEFDIRAKQKVWLFGPNGTGKTTIVKIINGEETLTEGEIQLGTNIKVGYFAQKQTKLNSDMSLLDSFIDETGCFFGDAHGMLKKFLFEKDDVKKRVKDLSPGQRARFAFAIFAFKDYDFLILDEPTNHLDIETKEVIENSLRDFEGTVLLVSHDRFFVERVGITNILNLTEGRLESF